MRDLFIKLTPNLMLGLRMRTWLFGVSLVWLWLPVVPRVTVGYVVRSYQVAPQNDNASQHAPQVGLHEVQRFRVWGLEFRAQALP